MTGATGEPADSVLIRRFLRGDEAAFRALYLRHTPRLRMTVWRLLGPHHDDTDDVVQETWLAGCRSMHGFNGDAKFSTWLTTIAIRRAQSRFSAQEEDAELRDVADETADSLTAIDLERAIARLPDKQRAIVVLHDIEGFTHEEIARQLGIPVGTSKVTLSRAREALRRMLPDGVSHVR
ncbi:MAG TPA: RNA polymerase sigma factor [Gemmatimonadaceae bacterium]|nr:RNA polymerase sigma factor [Gemmatimonadaceae bacterium]